jgi:molybdopterin-guanine dinucleotide biosynthesis protein A
MNASGLLLTGGSSLRMGRDKAGISLAGETLAGRAGGTLRSVVSPVIVVGHDAGSGLETITDPHEGPLVAFVAGAEALAARDATGPVLVVAADMPFVSPDLLRHLVTILGDADAALPVAGGRDQPLCACYAPAALLFARRLVADGKRAMHELIAALEVVRVPEEEWLRIAPPYALLDVDSPEDLAEAERILDSPA